MKMSNALPIPFQILVQVVLICFFVSCSDGSLPHEKNITIERNALRICSLNKQDSSADVCGFRTINRRILAECPDPNPYLGIELSTQGPLADEEMVNVTVTGVILPDSNQWIGLISPSTADVSDCPLSRILYLKTGDVKSHPLLCHYPVKSQFLTNDPSYTSCQSTRCERQSGQTCLLRTCSGTVTFHVVNIRTDIEFVFFGGGFHTPCIHARSGPVQFSNPKMPLYGHLSSVDSNATSMRLTWISGDDVAQSVQYGEGQWANSTVTTFTQADMCSSNDPSPAEDFGWHDPGYIHTALMTGLQPSHNYSYKYGSDAVGWSRPAQFSTPPAGGSSTIRFLVFGDMGKGPRDLSDEHYVQPGAIGVIDAVTEEVNSGNVDSIFHIGDVSYATGFLVEWDLFLQMITPVASRVSYMTAVGNHERDYPHSNSKYGTPDSGGECGVPYEKYFPMSATQKDKPWYSINQGPVHFTLMSTEHDWTESSEQYEWIKEDLASVDRNQTPWIIFTGHRPMYASGKSGLSELLQRSVDNTFPPVIEPLLFQYQVDLALWGHVHYYERMCSVYQKTCIANPYTDASGIDTYNSTTYNAPVHVVIGTGGFTLDKFENLVLHPWSLVRISTYGYARVNTTIDKLQFEFVNSNTREVEDRFQIIKVS